MNSLFSKLAFSLALLCASHASAQSLGWNSSFNQSPIGYYSNGSATGSPLIWTIGYFNNNFVPTSSNFNQWAANYVEVDRSTEITEESFHLVSASVDVAGDAAGKLIWLFAYNKIELIGTPAGEALLISQNGLLFPSPPSFDTFDIDDNPDDPSDNNFTVVWGQVDRRGDATGGRITGGGTFTNQLPDTSTEAWEIQTATWPVTGNETPLILSLATVSNPSLRCETDDGDGDGLSNLLEHFIGTNLNTPNTNYAAVGPSNPTTTSFTIPENRPSDVRYTLVYSPNLAIGSWLELAKCDGNAAWQLNEPLSTTPIANSREVVQFTTPTPPQKGFFRISYELISP